MIENSYTGDDEDVFLDWWKVNGSSRTPLKRDKDIFLAGRDSLLPQLEALHSKLLDEAGKELEHYLKIEKLKIRLKKAEAVVKYYADYFEGTNVIEGGSKATKWLRENGYYEQ
jgi:hypothetical protein